MALELSPAGRRYGALPSVLDDRDFGRPAFFLTPPTPRRKNYSNLQYAPTVKDQGAEGSCTANSKCSETEFLFKKFRGQTITLSPAFPYYKERELEGTLAHGDCGAQPRSSCYVLDVFGAPLLSEQPYIPGDFNTPPTDAQIVEAKLYRSGAYHRLRTLADIKSCIDSGYAFCVAFTVYPSFEGSWGDSARQGGLMPFPDTRKEQPIGGHQIFSGLAYDDDITCPGAPAGAVMSQNSWGVGWALGGRFWMPYALLTNPDIVSDIWIQHLDKAWRQKRALQST